METISNEIKAKVVAQYLGQKIRPNIGHLDSTGILYSVSFYMKNKEPAQIQISYTNLLLTESIDQCKLLLKPLSKISDEDAEEVGLKMYQDKFWVMGQIRLGLNRCFVGEAVDILRAKGYDCRNGLLGGKTLKECDLCTYE